MQYVVIALAIASQYSPGVMAEVIQNRQAGNAWVSLPERLPTVDGYIATRDCDHIGEVWWLRPVGQEHWESFLVVDCAGHQEAFDWMTRYNILVEVDYQTAVRWDTVGLGIEIERGLKIPRGLLP